MWSWRCIFRFVLSRNKLRYVGLVFVCSILLLLLLSLNDSGDGGGTAVFLYECSECLDKVIGFHRLLYDLWWWFYISLCFLPNISIFIVSFCMRLCTPQPQIRRRSKLNCKLKTSELILKAERIKEKYPDEEEEKNSNLSKSMTQPKCYLCGEHSTHT